LAYPANAPAINPQAPSNSEQAELQSKSDYAN
jgi:hypothetical protein